MSGPTRKADSELARDRARKGGPQETATRGTRLPSDGFDPDPDWHPTALRIYESIFDSGSRTFYQQSDWAMLWSVCEDLSKLKYEGRPSAVVMQTLYSALRGFLLTEADRRAVRIELHAPVVAKTDHRKAGQNVYAQVSSLDAKRDAKQ